MPKPVRRLVDWAVIGLIVFCSFYISSTGPNQASSTPPSFVVIPLPDDLSTIQCPAGYSDPEFGNSGIVCRWTGRNGSIHTNSSPEAYTQRSSIR